MRDHDEMRSMLAALAGGDLSATDRMLVEQHLADCQACRTELAQLQAVLLSLRATPDVQPPPWLATRIMARVREEASPQCSWLARLFLPLKIKLPLEAFALVMICVTAWYVMQEVDRSQQVQPDSAPVKAAPSGEPAAKDRAVQAVPPQPAAAPTARPGAPVAQEPPAAPAFVPPPQSVADRAEPMDRIKSASESAPAVSREQAASSPAPMVERKMATRRKAESSDNRFGTAALQPLRLRLAVNDRETVPVKLADILQRLGGSMIDSRPGTALVRIDAARLSDLLSQLALLGRVTEQPVVDANRTGVVELQVYW